MIAPPLAPELAHSDFSAHRTEMKLAEYLLRSNERVPPVKSAAKWSLYDL